MPYIISSRINEQLIRTCKKMNIPYYWKEFIVPAYFPGLTGKAAKDRCKNAQRRKCLLQRTGKS